MKEVSITIDGETETLKLRSVDRDDALAFLIEGYDPFLAEFPYNENMKEIRPAA